jgi:glycine betaine/proline transport system permease protein
LLTKVRLKLALPEILLGLNQTIMLALSMLVITALVGTRDLGQEVYIALTKATPAAVSSPVSRSPLSRSSPTG